MLQPKEEDLHILCADWLRLKEKDDPRYKRFHHSPNGQLRHKAIAAKLKRMGVKKGWPDFINPIPARGFNGLVVELKRPGERATKEQIEWLKFFRSIGYRAAVCSNFDAFCLNVEVYFS